MTTTALLGGAYSAEAQALIDGHTTDRANAQAKLAQYGEDDSMAPAWRATVERTTRWITELSRWLED